jgi:Secretion system C-terminal sorting domain
VNLEFDEIPNTLITITISDLLGNIIFSDKVQLEDFVYKIQTGKWSCGAYNIKINTSEEIIFSSKLIVNH